MTAPDVTALAAVSDLDLTAAIVIAAILLAFGIRDSGRRRR